MTVVQITLTAVLVLTLSGRGYSVTCGFNHIVKCTDELEPCDLGKLLGNFTKLVITRREIKLSTNVLYSHLENVSILGNKTFIDCQGEENTFMSFKSVKNLCLEGIIFRHCGGEIRLPNTSYKNRHFYGTLTIMRSTNVTLKNVQVEGSNGGGLYLEGVKGFVTILNSNFNQNPLNISCSRGKRRYGGGIFIDQLRSEIADDEEETMISIVSCTFIGNNIEYNTQNIDRRYTNHGGGVYISIKAPGNKIKVANCIFENNRAGYGGGMAITISNCSYNSTVMIKNSSFINNTAEQTLAQYGGGL